MVAWKPTDTKVKTAQANAKEQLVFTTSIVNRVSCGSNQFALTLKLRFKNTRNDPVILSKKIFIGSFIVSRTLEAAVAPKYVLSVRYSDFDVGPEDDFYRPNDLSRFVVLREEEVYESEERVSIPTHLVSIPHKAISRS